MNDPRLGISEAINVGVRAATDEEYYAWIGDDDLFRDGGLRILRDLLDADPRRVVAYGGCDYIDAEGRTIGTSRAGRAAQWLLPWGPDLIPHPGSIIRLDALRAIGLFDPSLKYAMDLDAFLSLRRHGRFLSTARECFGVPLASGLARRSPTGRDRAGRPARSRRGTCRAGCARSARSGASRSAWAAGIRRRTRCHGARRRLATETTREKA